jgi:hypothetical protein
MAAAPLLTDKSFVVPVVVIVALYAGGCARWDVTRLARFEPARSAGDVKRPAPVSAAYKVKYASTSGGGLRTLGGTKRIVAAGLPLGFTRGPDGTVVAVVGEEQIPLERLPPTTRYCVWTCKERVPTQFTREVGKAAATAGKAALVGGFVIGSAFLEGVDNDDDCDDERPRAKHRRRGYRWVGPDATPTPDKP